jgi:protein phosphatase
MSARDFSALLDGYLSALSDDADSYANQTLSLVLPTPDPDLLWFLFRQVQKLFQSDPILLDVKTPCVIIGDIHGQILDLLRILRTFRKPGPLHYLFLGDLVDRGEFSVETLIVAFLLKSLYPEYVSVIRGNHEFNQLCATSGFLTEITEVFGNTKLYEEAIRTFRHMPLAARVGKSILCVHGGIGPDIYSLDDISTISRPIEDFDDPTVDALVWSDPSDQVTTFERSSARGAGFLFGEAGLAPFLERSGLDVLVRAHECVVDGYEAKHGGKCLTVFSASNYCMSGNRGAVLEVMSGQSYRPRFFSALQWLSRKDVVFKMCSRMSVVRPPTSRVIAPKVATAHGLRQPLVSGGTTKQLPPLVPCHFEEHAMTQPVVHVTRGGQADGSGKKTRRLSHT